MKFLVVGNIIGEAGRKTATKAIQNLKKQYPIDFVIANGRNMDEGKGMTQENFEEMRKAGVDFFTTGSNVYDKESIFSEMEKPLARVIRPENYLPGSVGKGHRVMTVSGKRILILNLTPEVFMGEHNNCPFRTSDALLAKFAGEKFDVILVDMDAQMHEKLAMREYLNGRTTVIWGTFSRRPSKDAMITQNGTAYMTDVGMCGLAELMDQEEDRFKTLKAGEGPCVFNGILIEADSMKASSIKPVHFDYESIPK